VATNPDGSSVFVTGSSGATTAADYATIAYDAATGALLWARGYDGPGDSRDTAESEAVSPDGSTVFVTGSSLGSTNQFDYATLAYEA
jgi:hypothetical protein